jgi:serine/threonine protein kinase
VRITAEVASALLFLHSAPEPIIHLDLKPVGCPLR